VREALGSGFFPFGTSARLPRPGRRGQTTIAKCHRDNQLRGRLALTTRLTQSVSWRPVQATPNPSRS
jgi:hypothetical protein